MLEVKGFNRCVNVSVGQEPAQFHQVYPTVGQNISDLDMSHHECSDSSSLVSILSTLKMADELVITQMLSALECFQIQLAKCKAPTKQEKEVVAANFMHLFKVEPKVMAEALTKLDELSTSLVLLRSSSWPALAEFDIEKILIQVKALAKQAMEASFKVERYRYCLPLLLQYGVSTPTFNLLFKHHVEWDQGTSRILDQSSTLRR